MNYQELKQFTIVSTYRSEVPRCANKHVFNWVKSYLDGRMTNYKVLIGCYKGNLERSFLLTDFELAIIIAKSYDQESLLHRSADGPDCYLCFLDPETSDINLGPMIAVSKREARQQDSWTYDPSTKTYYICKGE